MAQRVLVTGSRHFADESIIRHELAQFPSDTVCVILFAGQDAAYFIVVAPAVLWIDKPTSNDTTNGKVVHLDLSLPMQTATFVETLAKQLGKCYSQDGRSYAVLPG